MGGGANPIGAESRAAGRQRGAAGVKAAMDALRQLIPTEPRDRRLSKVETLRLAAVYIAHLSATRSSLQQEEGTPRACTGGAPGAVCVFCVAERRHSVSR